MKNTSNHNLSINKNLLICIFLLVLSNFSIAQDKIEVTKFRTIKSGMILNYGKPEWSDNGEGILVTYTMKNESITKFNVYSNKENQYDVIRFYNGTKDDKNISWVSVDVLDKEGEKFVLKTGFIKNYPHVLTLIFLNEYGNGLIYELKPND